jgi:molybdate transport system substrate-binding protein
MPMNRLAQWIFGILLAAVAIVPAAAQVPARPLTVFAAASLGTALDAVGPLFTARTGVPVRFSFAGSPALARQIASGAPADVFASADGAWMDELERQGVVRASTRRDVLFNRLVLIAPADAAIQSLPLMPEAIAAALGPAGRLATGEVASVPVGRYAKAALAALGLWSGVERRLAQTENVRVALTFVSRGEAPLGIVYATDAQAEPRVRVVARFPQSSHPAIVYPFAVTRDAGSPEVAARFIAFLSGPEARAVFEAQGFAVAPSATE